MTQIPPFIKDHQRGAFLHFAGRVHQRIGDREPGSLWLQPVMEVVVKVMRGWANG